MGKPCRHHLNQVSKVNFTNNKIDSFSQSNYEKIAHKPKSNDIQKKSEQYFSKSIRIMKDKERLKTVRDWRRLADMTTKCNVGSWIES